MRRLLLLLFVPILLTACKVETKVTVDADDRGSGTVGAEVRLDEEATRAVPNLESQLRLDDLRAAGWKIDGPDVSDGKTTIKVTHDFDAPEEAGRYVDQLFAGGGPLRDFTLTRSSTITGVTTKFTGTVDLSKGVASWGDPALQQRIGLPNGFDPNEVKSNLALDPEQTFPISVDVNLPGNDRTFSPDLESGEWKLAYGQSVDLSAKASGWNTKPMIYFGMTALFLIITMLVAIIWQTYKPKHKR